MLFVKAFATGGGQTKLTKKAGVSKAPAGGQAKLTKKGGNLK